MYVRARVYKNNFEFSKFLMLKNLQKRFFFDLYQEYNIF